LPWDEPVKLPGGSRRERLLAKLDLIEACEAVYHLKLGARTRMGALFLRAWRDDSAVVDCLEWLDADELRHLRCLRQLEHAIRSAEQDGPETERRAEPARMWSVGRCPAGAPAELDALALRALVDEAATQCLLLSMSRQTRVPLARAVFSSCARDDGRHAALLGAIATQALEGTGPVHVVRMQGLVIRHVARLQSALRPYFPSFAAVTGGTIENVASELFRAVSQVVGELGPAWVRYPTARVVHAADRSPWMLWLLR
jgi:hypothetical protein